MKKTSIHVIRSPYGGWSVIKRGASRASKTFDSKEDAIVWGEQASKSEKVEFVIHKPDGTVMSRNSYEVSSAPERKRLNHE